MGALPLVKYALFSRTNPSVIEIEDTTTLFVPCPRIGLNEMTGDSSGLAIFTNLVFFRFSRLCCNPGAVEE
jgi:hypothetical protein